MFLFRGIYQQNLTRYANTILKLNPADTEERTDTILTFRWPGYNSLIKRLSADFGATINRSC